MTSVERVGLIALTVGAPCVAVLLDAAVARYAWRRRATAGSLSLAALAAASGWWALAYVAQLLATAPAAEMAFARAEWMGILAVPVAWLCFALAYTGRDRHLTTRGVAVVAALPALLVVGVWTNDAHHLMWTASVYAPVYGGFDAVAHVWGVGAWVAFGYNVVLLAAGSALLLVATVSLPGPYRRQTVTTTAGVALPGFAGVFIAALGYRPAVNAVVPAALVGVGLACALSIRWFGLLDTRPLPSAAARACVFEHTEDAVLVLDERDRIVDANAAAGDLFDATRADLRDTPADDLLPENARSDGSFTTTVDGSTHFFDVTETAVDDAHGRPMGTALVLRDVTERRHRIQRLEVLNRVLRHNFRNQVNVVTGYAELLAADVPPDRPDLARYAAAIERSASDLADTAEKARTIEQVVADDDDRTADVRLLVVGACADVQRTHPNATVTVSLDGLSARNVAVPWQVEAAVENLIENAAEHNPDPEPSVRVTVDRENGEVVVRVRDDGPGIPETERRALEAGHETALVHGDGLGLWIASWGARAAGGDVTFHDRGDGTEAVVRVPVSE
ncbi:signal transduction histidine kinase [Halarchaeum rubridurum]|uniref:histidine kinase n=1 Tax=Halarchaeum rubridurum TaxID=489911 RepID=A0A830G5Q0_9EURY|nr:histidine kinase N-terminal 7TM domain-containing protein [Halarchaeum rubridurum]MBP1955621.1 signal transduction histidine kinase [Halarchaeum rubridurum]GGM76570.1 hypothetical protein GCM10009017_27870 [Halarchaeum rubridurum]